MPDAETDSRVEPAIACWPCHASRGTRPTTGMQWPPTFPSAQTAARQQPNLSEYPEYSDGIL